MPITSARMETRGTRHHQIRRQRVITEVYEHMSLQQTYVRLSVPMRVRSWQGCWSSGNPV